MNEQNLFRSYSQLVTAIDYCIAEKLIMPALVLLYSAIDNVSWIASEFEDQSVGERFQTWVNAWMLQKYPLQCTAIELYSARCGILHTLTPESDLTKKKGVSKTRGVAKKRARYLRHARGYTDQDNIVKDDTKVNHQTSWMNGRKKGWLIASLMVYHKYHVFRFF